MTYISHAEGLAEGAFNPGAVVVSRLEVRGGLEVAGDLQGQCLGLDARSQPAPPWYCGYRVGAEHKRRRWGG